MLLCCLPLSSPWATVSRPMGWAHSVSPYSCEYAVSSLVTEQDRAREQLYRTCPYKAPCYSFSIGILLFYYMTIFWLSQSYGTKCVPFQLNTGRVLLFLNTGRFRVSRGGCTALCTAVHRLAPALVAALWVLPQLKRNNKWSLRRCMLLLRLK